MKKNIVNFVQNLISWTIGIAVTVPFLLFFIAGIQTAYELKQEKTAKAKERIAYAAWLEEEKKNLFQGAILTPTAEDMKAWEKYEINEPVKFVCASRVYNKTGWNKGLLFEGKDILYFVVSNQESDGTLSEDIYTTPKSDVAYNTEVNSIIFDRETGRYLPALTSHLGKNTRWVSTGTFMKNGNPSSDISCEYHDGRVFIF